MSLILMKAFFLGYLSIFFFMHPDAFARLRNR
jgi:hypothetical protein